ncbi:Probable cardiolipin synthase (CMP-forming) [Geodia barretti]|uniref:cardiolipin synthase (CMP-forming) n=1 Tax=Geodia barretti TaxID=519541 RepID=A0AA35TYU0_GEOBA|nr:Probable cardiolipin synthase (CMP-forming) [Geodia barretti]
MWRCLLPTRCGGWVVVKSLWWRTVCTYCCRSLQRPCTAAFRVPKSSRWRSPLVALTQAPQVSGHRGLAVSVARHRDSDRGGGGGGAHKPDTGVSEEDDHHSFEKENIWTIPNVLSLSRILLSPILGYQVLQESYLMAFGLLAVAAVSDVVDGQIARHYPGQSSMLGSVLDPLADKCLLSILCITLTVQGLIPLPLTVVILSRDAVLIGASFYLRYTTLPPPRTWSRYWDIQRSTLRVTPSPLSKLNTLLQLSTVGLSLGAALVNASHHPLLQALWVTTAVSTVMSGASYLIQMKGFKILRKRRSN